MPRRETQGALRASRSDRFRREILVVNKTHLMYGVIVIVVAGVLVWAVQHPSTERVSGVAAPVPAAAAAQQPQSGAAAAEAPADPELQAIPRMTATDLSEAMSTQSVVVIDVRDAQSFLAGHIAGAKHIPLSYLAGELPYLPRDKAIVTYCT
jgi:3-mercaptopyruvate sulfurtransferase SseA